MGPSDDEVKIFNTSSRRVSIESFWMDDTEITNNEYRQFVYWVRDSIARTLLAQVYPEFMYTETAKGVPLTQPIINWREKINWRNEDHLQAIDDLFMPEHERFAFTRRLIPESWFMTTDG